MSIFPIDIFTAKEYPDARKPIFLCQFVLIDGSAYYFCSANANGQDYLTYGGNEYLARVLNQDMPATQGNSGHGIDVIPSVDLQLNDADGTLAADIEDVTGFAGAILSLIFVLYDPLTGAFSTNNMGMFVGRCSGASSDENQQTLTIYAESALNLENFFFPLWHIQPRCLWAFPPDAPSRAAAINPNRLSQFCRCRYSPDQTGTTGNPPLGDFMPGTTTPYTTCRYIVSDCKARGMYSTDHNGNITGSFSGIQYQPPEAWSGKSYTQGTTINGYNAANQAVYNQYIPEVAGAQFLLNCPVTYISGDPNSTRCIVVVCGAYLGNGNPETPGGCVSRVIVNDVICPPNYSGHPPADNLFWYSIGNPGYYGGSAGDSHGITGGQGDPYGSIANIWIVVPVELATSDSTPRVQILVENITCIVPTDTNPAHAPWNLSPTKSPAWIILDKYIRSGWIYANIDLQTFFDFDTYCSTSITYTDLSGNTGATHARFMLGHQVNTKTSAAETIEGLRNSCNAYVLQDPNTGRLQIFAKRTLADQQPAAIAGSNYNTPVVSVTAAGATANGYVAYSFDESNIDRSTLQITYPHISELKTTVTITFQDQDNQYQQDSLTMTDPDAVNIVGHQTENSLNAPGILNFDQATRIGNVYLAENLRGNARDAAQGTMQIAFDTTQKVVSLRIGHIVFFSDQKRQISQQMFRIWSIKPSTDGKKWSIVAKWHRDEWYEDLFGQNPAPFYSNPANKIPNRLPWPWQPAQIISIGSSPVVPQGFQFAVTQQYVNNTDGTAQAQINIKGNPPINVVSTQVQPPLLPLQGTASTTGGYLLPGTYYVGISAVDSAGLLSGMSKVCTCVVPPGTTTGSLTIPILVWPSSGTVGYYAFIGQTHLTMSAFVGTATAITSGSFPSSITIDSSGDFVGAKNVTPQFGPPDVVFDHFRVRAKIAGHLGVWGAEINAVDAGTITITSASWTTNQWAGYTISLIARYAGTGQAPINVLVTSNTANVLTCSHPAGPLSSAFNVGDVIVMRTKASVFSANTIGDPNFANNTPGSSPTGLITDAEKGNICRIIYGTGAGLTGTITGNTASTLTIDQPWIVTPDATSVFIVENPDWAVDVPTISMHTSAVPILAGNVHPIATVAVQNLKALSILVQVLTADKNGNLSPSVYAPWRDTFLFGAPGTTGAISQYVIADITSGTAAIDLSLGLKQEVVGTASGPIAIADPINYSGNPTFQLFLLQDATGGNVFTVGPNYIGIDPSQNVSDAGKATIYTLTIKDATHFIVSGIPLINQLLS